EGYEYGSFHFLEPSFLHNYTDSTKTPHPFKQSIYLILLKQAYIFSPIDEKNVLKTLDCKMNCDT
ncbi:hypothetical protein ABNF16_04920, partial [Paenibacillus larvae]